jgi:hypothetical protein
MQASTAKKSSAETQGLLFAALQARTIFGFRRSAASNGSRHGNALGTRFDERLDIMSQDVQMNVTTAILDASGVLRVLRFESGCRINISVNFGGIL